MPTGLRIRGLRFHFYSDEGTEPAHIHIRSAEGECKFWLSPISLVERYRNPEAVRCRCRCRNRSRYRAFG
ncbi:MAG: DUF4160 domain-containing protein [Thiohalocapsa sp. PB-PSB1]|nr:MAG: DUF4160 domain-containing protein [Thiohalocapsa sp. PB-PSB1]